MKADFAELDEALEELEQRMDDLEARMESLESAEIGRMELLESTKIPRRAQVAILRRKRKTLRR